MSDKETKEKILQTVRDMLSEGFAAKNITVRQIAARAGVGIGTISYHYHSKDKLLSDAVSEMMAGLAGSLAQQETQIDPLLQLKQFLLSISEMSIHYYEISKIQVTFDLEQGDFSICYYILPLLKQLMQEKSETEIKLAAIQLITSMQVVFLKKDAYHRFSGLDLQNASQREQTINLLLENIIPSGKGGELK